MKEKDYANGFQRGWAQVSVGNSKEIRKKICEALKIKSRTSFYYYLRGQVQCSAIQAQEVEKVFMELNITEVWGN